MEETETPGGIYAVEGSSTLYQGGLAVLSPGIEPWTYEVIDAAMFQLLDSVGPLANHVFPLKGNILIQVIG